MYLSPINRTIEFAESLSERLRHSLERLVQSLEQARLASLEMADLLQSRN